jgi:uncharacterized protein YdaU (DUF1376 family)
MEVEYGLITSSAVPEQLRASKSFMEVDKNQWYDLVDYAKSLDPTKESEKVMVLVVAHGTPEEEAAEQKRLEKEAAEVARLKAEEQKNIQQKQSEQEKQESEQREQSRLRARSKEILNALYGR